MPASLEGRAARGQGGRDFDVVTSPLNTLDNPSKNTKRKRQRARRRSTTNILETMPTNAEMHSVGPVARQSYTMARDTFVAWARTQRFRLDEDLASLKPVLLCCMDKALHAKGDSAAVAQMTLFGTIYCGGIPRHPQIMSRCGRSLGGFVRDDPQSFRRTHYRWKGW